MVRVNKIETCIFCGDTPCTCNAKTKAEPKPRKPRKAVVKKVTESVEVAAPTVPAVSIQDAMVAAAARKAPPPKEVQAVMEDLDVCVAIQAIESIMHPDEKKKWKPVLDMEITPQARAASWRARNNVVVE